MQGEINNTIIKLKSLLQEKYGKDFSKFYLVNHETEDWCGLITQKTKSNGRQPGEYYKIKGDGVVMED